MFESGDDAGAQKLGDLGGHRAEADQVVDAQLFLGELSDGDASGRSSEMGGMTTLTREPSGRRASTIGRGLVDVAAERRDDAVDDAADVLVVVELDVAQQQAALALEVDLLGAVDHDLGDGRRR